MCLLPADRHDEQGDIAGAQQHQEDASYPVGQDRPRAHTATRAYGANRIVRHPRAPQEDAWSRYRPVSRHAGAGTPGEDPPHPVTLALPRRFHTIIRDMDVR
jgi:hypothetical protein